MGRLTWKKPDGTWGLVNGDIKEVPREYYGHMCKLKDYEETGLDPERIEEVNELYLEKCKEVNELQEKFNNQLKVGGWIPVREIPKKVDRYLCDVLIPCDGSRRIVIAKYDKYWHIADGDVIIAWQPLPAQYQQKGE